MLEVAVEGELGLPNLAHLEAVLGQSRNVKNPSGRRIHVEIEWPAAPNGHRKKLTCRGTVETANEMSDGGLLLGCRLRRGRFTDVKPAVNGKVRPIRPPENWMM